MAVESRTKEKECDQIYLKPLLFPERRANGLVDELENDNGIYTVLSKNVAHCLQHNLLDSRKCILRWSHGCCAVWLSWSVSLTTNEHWNFPTSRSFLAICSSTRTVKNPYPYPFVLCSKLCILTKIIFVCIDTKIMNGGVAKSNKTLIFFW